MRTRRMMRGIVGLVALLVAAVVLAPTQVGGPAAYVIVDGTSMEPTYEDGDLVVTRRASDYAVGDIVTFRSPDGFDSGFTVIHRITEETDEGLITRGDNRDEDDPWVLDHDDIVGRSLLHVPGVGRWLLWVRSSPLALGLFAGVVTFLLVLPSRRDASRDAPSSPDAPPSSDASATPASSPPTTGREDPGS